MHIFIVLDKKRIDKLTFKKQLSYGTSFIDYCLLKIKSCGALVDANIIVSLLFRSVRSISKTIFVGKSFRLTEFYFHTLDSKKI